MSFTVWHFVVLYIQDYFRDRVYILDSRMWYVFFSFISKFYVLIILLLWNCLLIFSGMKLCYRLCTVYSVSLSSCTSQNKCLRLGGLVRFCQIEKVWHHFQPYLTLPYLIVHYIYLTDASLFQTIHLSYFWNAGYFWSFLNVGNLSEK
jgi:hypothetical protein